MSVFTEDRRQPYRAKKLSRLEGPTTWFPLPCALHDVDGLPRSLGCRRTQSHRHSICFLFRYQNPPAGRSRCDWLCTLSAIAGGPSLAEPQTGPPCWTPREVLGDRKWPWNTDLAILSRHTEHSRDLSALKPQALPDLGSREPTTSTGVKLFANEASRGVPSWLIFLLPRCERTPPLRRTPEGSSYSSITKHSNRSRVS